MRDQTNFFLFLGVYSIVTFLLFHLVYNTSKQVIDEEFHLRQGEHYCRGRFHIWDEKITTFPGLYLISGSFLSPFKACSAYFLRLTSAVASIANAYLVYIIRKAVIPRRSDAYLLLESISLATLPPLYFFSHLYYTDVLSVTMVLMMVYFSVREMHNWGALAGFLAILMRQTNVVWVGFVYGSQLVNMTMSVSLAERQAKQKPQSKYGFMDLIPTVTTLLERPALILNVLRDAHSKFLGYELNLAGFVCFLWYNGSIVVGDKTAHVAAVHLPQIFYFSLFFAAFSPSHVLGTVRRVARFALKRWYVSCFCVGLFLCVIQLNTIVHPYLLADNRHYTFYIWMRFYQRWTFAKFLPVPIYHGILVLLGLILFTRGQGGQTVGFSLLWMLATLASVALQQLIEVRYFILPFLVLRLLQTNVQSSTKLLALEVLANVLINAATFYIFCTKAVYWSDYTEPQRIIW
ncbi:putative Dol-P-Glc:Glc(2)Man(9)GlcNAc(2)-PP-Dol alpha-1,2-glucosyltransferase [Culex quinquefasciatus]|uniref:putative Dol-P-Glc:Glc(2)Man(9)GlcNAc(2)-PP-Dol alpha-1,2-glucosyltransferase n=1 Tax=Culex quinquefasciatus TaxID=7176 RepID=UPI0018E2DB9E|nr:putative Dol-P-Glc:Glc(2)Man(9)GlcNAc(2)-PP-Dol alpha-1,2-glucosyltransferase [Culex quinquefasciatus]